MTLIFPFVVAVSTQPFAELFLESTHGHFSYYNLLSFNSDGGQHYDDSAYQHG